MRWTLPIAAVVLVVLAGPKASAQTCPLGEEPDSPACCWSVDADYVLWWLRRGRVPAVLVSDSGVGYGDDRVETRHGDRFNGVRFAVEWRDGCGLGVEGRGFFLERDSTYFKATSDGTQLLALPFVNAATGLPDRLVVAGLDPQRGALSGGFVGYSRIELFGEEVNGVASLAEGESGRLDLLAGARFLQMRDRFRTIATSQMLPARNVLTGVVDNFRTGNAFYGAQVGVRGEWWWQRFFVAARATVAMGGDDQKVRTFGQRVVQTTSGRSEIETGLYVQASNSGQFTRGQVDGAGEVAVNLGCALGEHVRVTVGYSLLDWFAPLRAGDQVDRVVNLGPAPAPARPVVPFKTDNLWAQGLNVGLEVRW
jgi:hypothetical protein